MNRLIYYVFIVIIFTTNTNSVSAQCQTVNCNNTTASGDYSTAIGDGTTAAGFASFSSGFEAIATGRYSAAFGVQSEANGYNSFAVGMMSEATKGGSVVIGHFLRTTANDAFILGRGESPEEYLVNNEPYSLMIGFKSINPTFFIGQSTTSSNHDLTGRVGIGNMNALPNGPEAKLHIRADDSEEAAVFIEPNNWSAGEIAKLVLGNTEHCITTDNILGMEFLSQNNFVFSGKNSGFGIEEPKAKVHINGDLLFEHNLNGIIMKSEDGNCWKGIISNNGELIFSQVDCETLSSTENITEPKHSEVFIYPNPTNGQMTVEYTGNKKNLRLEIKSISGLLIATHKISKGENRIELNNISDQMIIASVFTKKGELVSTNKVVIKK